ncbi:MAG TPA: hypothetical protein VG841_12495 [Caulobacterales bacterium]|nr:hypothetical protein [Caulobacterales bacterium]
MSEIRGAEKRPIHPVVDTLGTIAAGAAAFAFIAQLYVWFAP